MTFSQKIAKTTLFIAALFTIGLFANNADAVSFTQAEKDKLAAGQQVRQPLPKSGEQGFYGGTGYVVIDAPPEVVWRAIEDWGSYPKIFPKTVSVEEVSRSGDKSLLRMKMGHKLISLEYYMHIERDYEKLMLSFKLVKNKPHDIESSRGYWRLFPQKDGRTLVAYVVAAQVPMGILNLIPPELVSKIERNLIGAPNELRKWIGKNGKKYYNMSAKK